jgi:hypothetical protein
LSIAGDIDVAEHNDRKSNACAVLGARAVGPSQRITAGRSRGAVIDQISSAEIGRPP